MNKAKQYSVLLILLITFFSPNHIQSHEEQTRDFFDDLITFVEDPEVSEMINNTVFDTTRKSSKPVVITLLSNLDFFPILQENFFLKTNKLKTRSILDYPEYFPWRHDKDKRAVYVDLFFNQTSRLNFTSDSSNICSYLAITQAGFLGAVETFLNELERNTGFKAELALNILDLFQTFTVQERRLGLMIGGKTTWNRWHFNIMAPWYYLERNHFVNQEVQDDLEEVVGELVPPPTTPEELAKAERMQTDFQDQHLICDKLGIGDTRIYLDYPIIKKKYLSTRLGILTTIPTAFAMVKGLKGTSLHLVKNRPLLDLQEAIDFALNPTGQPISDLQAYDFGIAALDNLGAMLLEAPLGNGGHFGLGIFARNRSPLTSIIKQDWARRVVMRSFISLEYLFPATEWRSFRIPVNEALFNARDLNNDQDLPVVNSNYAFILQQLTDRIFPVALQARVHPGVIFRWSSQMCYEGDYAGFSFGTDTYVRNKEKLRHIDAYPALKKMIDSYNARYPTAYQSKLAGSIFFKVDKPDKLWTISLFADYTFMNRGIGADFTLTLNTDVVF